LKVAVTEYPARIFPTTRNAPFGWTGRRFVLAVGWFAVPSRVTTFGTLTGVLAGFTATVPC
jgi:hypothetical protein